MKMKHGVQYTSFSMALLFSKENYVCSLPKKWEMYQLILFKIFPLNSVLLDLLNGTRSFKIEQNISYKIDHLFSKNNWSELIKMKFKNYANLAPYMRASC